MNTKMLTLLGGLILSSAIGSALAAPAAPAPSSAPKADIFATLANTKISLDDAIKAAEHAVVGKPIKAILDDESTPVSYRVAIADSTNRTVTFVKIDSTTGSVLDSRVYRPDNKAKAGPALGVKPAPVVKAPALPAAAPAASVPAATAPAQATDNPLKKAPARVKPSAKTPAASPVTAPAATAPATPAAK